MEFYAIIFTVIISTLRLYADALTCLSCDNISHPRNCHVVSQCGPREVCYQKSITASDHSKAYELGCTDPSLNKNFGGYCNSTIFDASGQRCYECCNTDLCNSELCGQRGYPKDRGPICYACDSRLRGEKCNFIDFCEKDEVCSINQRLEFSEVVYTNECSHKHVCEGHSLTFVGKRTIPVCHTCCTSDLCNVNCTYHSHTDYCSNDTCKNGGACENGTYGYICHCPKGFGGKNCDPDPCQSSPCKNGGGCMTVTSGYVCVCQQGFIGSHCETDPCQSGPCLNNGTCSLAGNSYTCACPAGVLGQNCEIDACKAAPCNNGGTCSFTNGTFSCKCPDGVAGDRCEIDPCSTVHCQNGARCQGFGSSGYVCVCVLGYSGLHCEFDSCTNGPCKNGGTCNLVTNNYTCTCPSEFKGDNCEHVKDPCHSGPCKNGGTCTVAGDAYQCACPAGYMGTECDHDMCYSKPCLNGGACLVFGTSFACACTASYKGTHCEIDPCQQHNCSNGGTCHVHRDGFTCTCSPQFTGRHCEIGVCSPGACQNGGTCLDGVGGYKCVCLPQFKGSDCEIALCTGGTCMNGGTCLDTAQGYQCSCPPGFSGRQCEAGTACGSDSKAVNAVQVNSLWLPSIDKIIRVPCDVKTDGGGWMIFQNRFDGSVSFHRSFSEYEHGFGDATGEFWLGLNDTYEVMAQCPTAVWELRIDMVDGDGLPGYELFRYFSLAPPPKYTLLLGSGSGTAIRYSTQDLGFAYHNSSDFSTFDHDTTKSNCTALDRGGWWYYNCAYVNLNGVYLQPPGTIAMDHHGGESGMIYFSFDRTRSLQSSQMKIRVLPATKC